MYISAEFEKGICLIDFDSTLVQAESLDELAGFALEGRSDREDVLQRIGSITTAGVGCEIGFDESLDRRLSLFDANRGHVDMVVEALGERLSPSVLEHRDWFRENAESIYVLSGGFKDIIVPVIAQLGLRDDHILANQFIYDGADSIVGYDRANPLSQSRGKVTQVAALGLPRPRVMYGDGWTDFEVRQHGEAELFCAVVETVTIEKAVAVADIVLPKFVPPHLLPALV